MCYWSLNALRKVKRSTVNYKFRNLWNAVQLTHPRQSFARFGTRSDLWAGLRQHRPRLRIPNFPCEDETNFTQWIFFTNWQVKTWHCDVLAGPRREGSSKFLPCLTASTHLLHAGVSSPLPSFYILSPPSLLYPRTSCDVSEDDSYTYTLSF